MPEPTTLASATVLTRVILPEMLAQTLSVFPCVGSPALRDRCGKCNQPSR
jgi:hypothetical protein